MSVAISSVASNEITTGVTSEGISTRPNIPHRNDKTSHLSPAFTLAEVLITLGIVGVVAALTIPSLMTKVRHLILKNQFKKSVALVSQAIRRTKADLDIDTLAVYCTLYTNTYVNARSCTDSFFNNFVTRGVRSASSDIYWDISRSRTNDVKNYLGKPVTYSDFGSHGFQRAIFNTNAMPDGEYLGAHIENGKVYISVDTNGSGKPNRFGHDIFIFEVNPTDDSLRGITGTHSVEDYDWAAETGNNPCDFSSTQKGNGMGCAVYALKDKCPDGSERGYFDCLPK